MVNKGNPKPDPNAGYHNSDLAKAGARILKSGSWKKQRVVMMMPAGDTVPFKVALAMRSLIFPPNQAAHVMGALGMEVGDAYSSAIASVLAEPNLSTWEFILTMEHDNLPPVDGLVKLIARMEAHPEMAAISGLYHTKGPEGVPQIWGDPNDGLNFRPQPPRPGELVECCGIGMGFALWRLSMFKDARLRRPWFRTIAGAQGVGTQDLYFAADARQYGYRFAVDCDVLVGHYDLTGQFGIPDFVW